MQLLIVIIYRVPFCTVAIFVLSIKRENTGICSEKILTTMQIGT